MSHQHKLFYYGLILTGLSIALHALGHHALQRVLTDSKLSMYQTASTYLLWGGTWIMLLGIARQHFYLSPFGIALILIGIILFCGSLLLYILIPTPILMMITPIGGISMIFGFLICGIQHRKT